MEALNDNRADEGRSPSMNITRTTTPWTTSTRDIWNTVPNHPHLVLFISFAQLLCYLEHKLTYWQLKLGSSHSYPPCNPNQLLWSGPTLAMASS